MPKHIETMIFVAVSAVALWGVFSAGVERAQESGAPPDRRLFGDWERFFSIRPGDDAGAKGAGAALSDLFAPSGKRNPLLAAGKRAFARFAGELPQGRLLRISEKDALNYYSMVEVPEKWGVRLPGGLKVGFEPGDRLKNIAGELWEDPTLDVLQRSAPGIVGGALESLQFDLKIKF